MQILNVYVYVRSFSDCGCFAEARPATSRQLLQVLDITEYYANVTTEPTCTVTASSPIASDCLTVAAYLRSAKSVNAVAPPNKTGGSNCTVLHASGTCVASLCGSPTSGSIPSSEAADYVTTLATICQAGWGETYDCTIAEGNNVPFGYGGLRVKISPKDA